jgi:hypothetical protein
MRTPYVFQAFMRPPRLRLDQFPTPEEAAANIPRMSDALLADVEGEVFSMLTVPQDDAVQVRLGELVSMCKDEQSVRSMAARLCLGQLWAAGRRDGWGTLRGGALAVWRTPDGPYSHSGKWFYAPCPSAPRGVGPCASEFAAMRDLLTLTFGDGVKP